MNVESRVIDIIRTHLGLPDSEEINLGTDIVEDLGADSLDTIEIVMAIEEEFDIEIEDSEAEKAVTVGKTIELVSRLDSKN